MLRNAFKSILKNSRKNYTKTSRVYKEIIVSHLTEKLQGTSVISLNRPKSRNALGQQLVEELYEALDEIRHGMPRVLIIKSEVEGVFCSGADLKERALMSKSEGEAFVNKLRTLFNEVERLPMPTIACISGFALGGGCELSLGCDIRIAEKETSLIGLTETSLAIIPGAGGTQRLPRLVGLAKAKELIYTARKLKAEEAEKIGLVNYAVEKGQSYAKALEIASEILPNGPIAIKVAKIAIQEGLEMSKASGFVLEQQCYAQVLQSQDRLEGLQAFKEKRSPNYKGE